MSYEKVNDYLLDKGFVTLHINQSRGLIDAEEIGFDEEDTETHIYIHFTRGIVLSFVEGYDILYYYGGLTKEENAELEKLAGVDDESNN